MNHNENDWFSRTHPSGSKARQREDLIDRSIPFSDALRKYRVPATDIDFVVTDAAGAVRLVIEATACDNRLQEETAKYYLMAIDRRRRSKTQGNNNDELIQKIANLMGAKAILVVFDPSVEWDEESDVWWRWVDESQWQQRKAKPFFEGLRAFAFKNETDK